jgi:hypothetical protein
MAAKSLNGIRGVYGTLRNLYGKLRNSTYFKSPLVVYIEYFGDLSQKCSILRARPCKLPVLVSPIPLSGCQKVESAWRIRNTQSVQEVAEQAGIQRIFANAEQKQENRIKAVRSFIAYRKEPGFEIFYSESGDFMRSKGYELIRRLLESRINEIRRYIVA